MKTSTLFVVMLIGGLAIAAAGCGSDGTDCGAGTVEMDGECVPNADACGDDATFNPATGRCEGNACAPGTTLSGDECVPDGSVICGEGTTYNEDTGECDPEVTGCGEGTVLDVATGECVDPAELWDPDVAEPSEDNGFAGTPGTFDTPAVGESVTIGGCIEPVDLDTDGATDADFDVYVFATTGPALLDITVQGAGGLSGGFLLLPTDEQLDADGWFRGGVNLVDESAKRHVYIPKAGTYALAVTDGRSVLNGIPAGGPDACYLATIQNLAIPAPTAISGGSVSATFEHEALFYSYDTAEGDVLFNTLVAPSDAALSDFVQVLNDGYAGSAGSDRAFGDDGSASLDGLADSDEVVFVIDPVINVSLDPVDFTLDVLAPVVGALPTAGTVTVDADGTNFRWMYFDAQAGDILEIDLASDGDLLDVTIVGPGLSLVSYPCEYNDFEECDALGDSFFQLPAAGRYYVRLFDTEIFSADPPPASFDLTVNHEIVTPASFADSVTAAALGGRGVTWYEFDASTVDWVSLTGDPTSFGGAMDVLVYDRTAAGEVGVDFGSSATFTYTAGGGEEYGRVLAGDDSVVLLGVWDDGTPTGSGTFDFAVTDRDYDDLGIAEPGAPIVATDETVADGITELYLLYGNPGDQLTVSVTGKGGYDPQLVQFGTDEAETVLDATGADATESFQVVLGDGPDSYVAIGVRNGTGAAGTFDLDVGAVSPLSGSSSPAAAIPDNDTTGISDTIAIGTSCSVNSMSVDMNITHTFRGDLIVSLESPTGTVVLLHDRTGGSEDNLIGRYPTTLTPAGTLDDFAGEEAMGDWTLTVTDNAGFDTGTLNDWGVTFFCD